MVCTGVAVWLFVHMPAHAPATTAAPPQAPAVHPPTPTAPSPPANQPLDAADALGELWHITAQAMRSGNTAGLRALYDTSSTSGRWALEHQTRRIKYVNAWAAKRGVEFVESKIDYRVVRSEKRSSSVWMYVIQSASYGYVYKNDAATIINRFGIGTRHVVELVRRNGQWQFKRDWFTDPLDEDTLIPDVVPALASGEAPPWVAADMVLQGEFPSDITGEDEFYWVADQAAKAAVVPAGKWYKYAREAAVAYADTYCGAAVGCGNNGRYNQKYRDYTGLGGDCTNFVSQALGDSNGGVLPKTAMWRYNSSKGQRGGGSVAWVQTDSFARFLMSSGMARRVGRGTLPKLAQASEGKPLGLVGTLRPGDVIGYQEKGDLVHFAIITAKDSKGVPLVNSHTADRYHVPWDLGWDRNTVYWLFAILD